MRFSTPAFCAVFFAALAAVTAPAAAYDGVTAPPKNAAPAAQKPAPAAKPQPKPDAGFSGAIAPAKPNANTATGTNSRPTSVIPPSVLAPVVPQNNVVTPNAKMPDAKTLATQGIKLYDPTTKNKNDEAYQARAREIKRLNQARDLKIHAQSQADLKKRLAQITADQQKAIEEMRLRQQQQGVQR